MVLKGQPELLIHPDRSELELLHVLWELELDAQEFVRNSLHLLLRLPSPWPGRPARERPEEGPHGAGRLKARAG